MKPEEDRKGIAAIIHSRPDTNADSMAHWHHAPDEARVSGDTI